MGFRYTAASCWAALQHACTGARVLLSQARLNRLIKIESTKGGHLWLHSRLFFRVKISRLVSAMSIPRRKANTPSARQAQAQLLVSYRPLALVARDRSETAIRTHCEPLAASLSGELRN